MPQRHGRPNESDIDDRHVDAEPRRGRPRGSLAADRSGSTGRSVTTEPDAGPTFDASTPPLAHTNPCCGLGDEHAVRHPDDAPRLAQDDLDLARDRGRSARRTRSPRDAARRWSGRRRRPRPSTRSSGSRPDVVGGQRQRAAGPLDGVADEHAEVVAVADLGDPVEGEDVGPRARQPTPRPPVVRPLADSTKTRSSAVSRSTRQRPVELDRGRAGGQRPRRDAPAGCPRPNAKSMASGGRRPRAFVPVPCRSVTRTTIGAASSECLGE